MLTTAYDMNGKSNINSNILECYLKPAQEMQETVMLCMPSLVLSDSGTMLLCTLKLFSFTLARRYTFIGSRGGAQTQW